jgi:hypothetical protein
MNRRFKLYRDGQFFDLAQDLDEERPLDPGTLDGEARAAHKQLQGVLDRFRDARPAGLKSQGGKPARRTKTGK